MTVSDRVDSILGSKKKMTVSDRVEITRTACEAALASSPLADVETFLDRRGVTASTRIEMLRHYTQTRVLAPKLAELHAAVTQAAIDRQDPSAFARALLVRASLESLSGIALLPVDDSVKHLFCREFMFYSKPSEGTAEKFAITQYAFVAMGKIALLDRFPAGQQQWEVSGLPVNWLTTVPPRMSMKLAWFLATKVGGLQPYLVSHMPVSSHTRRFLLEREYRQAFYRMSAAIERQPKVRAIMGASWLHSRETHRVSPHLAFMNHPHLEAGGIYADVCRAPENPDFLIGDKMREELYRAGKYKPTIGVVICTREQAIEWKRKHADIEASLAIP